LQRGEENQAILKRTALGTKGLRKSARGRRSNLKNHPKKKRGKRPGLHDETVKGVGWGGEAKQEAKGLPIIRANHKIREKKGETLREKKGKQGTKREAQKLGGGKPGGAVRPLMNPVRLKGREKSH